MKEVNSQDKNQQLEAAAEPAKKLTDEQMEQVTGGVEHDSVRVIIKDRPKDIQPILRLVYSIKNGRDS